MGNYDLDSLDDVDRQIIEILQQDPKRSHSEIGKMVNKSQPAVGARILKLQRQGLIGFEFGINFKTSGMPLMIVDCESNDQERIMKRAEVCPYVLNVFNKTGHLNYEFLITGASINSLNKVIDNCMRRDPTIKSLESSFVVDIKNQLILPINFEFEQVDLKGCPLNCPFNMEKEALMAKARKDEIAKKKAIAEEIDEFHELKIYYNRMLESIKEYTKADAVGLRLLDSMDQIQFYSWDGFSDEFYRSENNVKAHECLCGLVSRGEANKIPENSTEFGSLFINNMENANKLLQGTDAGKKINYRGVCHQEGYKSLALIPLKSNDEVLGLLYVSAYRENAFNDEIKKTLEVFAELMAKSLITLTVSVSKE